MTLLHLTKAFGSLSVNHDILIRKLEHYDVRGVPYQKGTNYVLEQHTLKSREHQLWSSARINTRPILFLIYINSLPSSIEKFKICLYADQNSLLVLSESSQDEIEKSRATINMRNLLTESFLVFFSERMHKLHFQFLQIKQTTRKMQ